MGKVISFSNKKGGVGKTTTAAALICGLHQRGAKVLGIDLDPQGNLGFNLGEQNDLSGSLGDMDLTSDNFTFSFFHRSYVGLDAKGRFGLFAELDLSYATGTSRFTYKSGDETRYTRSKNAKLKLAFNPGIAVYIFPNVCGTLSFGLGGLQYGRVRQFDEAGNKTGSRTASKMRFRLNLADINIGMVIHLWDKKKE